MSEKKYTEDEYQALRRSAERSRIRLDQISEEQRKEQATVLLLTRENENLSANIGQLQRAYDALLASKAWKATWPARRILSGVRRLLHKSDLCVLAVQACRNGWKTAFPHYTAEKFVRKNFQGAAIRADSFLTADQLYDFARANPTEGPLISIIVPMYNTEENHFRQMVDSVLNQTYRNWELCLADASDDGNVQRENIAKEYERKQSRIHYNRLAANYGIAGNTNAALKMSKGQWMALLDHDDILHPTALYYIAKAALAEADFIYTDEQTFDTDTRAPTVVHLKPDFAPDTLCSVNYICHLTAFSKELYQKTGEFRSEFDGSQDYDIILRMTEKATKIIHVPYVLYYWRAHSGSVAENICAKQYCIDAAIRAIEAHYQRVGLVGKVRLIKGTPGFYKTDFALIDEPLISILIPNKDHTELLETCVNSILEKSTYSNYEILVVENNSNEAETFHYYEKLSRMPHIRILRYVGEFNYSRINNFARKEARGKYLILLNNDTEIITPGWMEELLMYAQRADVGAVGALLRYPNGRVQHAGIVMGMLTLAGHVNRMCMPGEPGYMGRLLYVQNVSAVTGACLMVSAEHFDEVGGLDPGFAVAFNDVDFCLKLREKGLLNLFTPFAELTHFESVSRGSDETADRHQSFLDEVDLCRSRWKKVLEQGDPYYNPNLSLESESCRFQLRPFRT